MPTPAFRKANPQDAGALKAIARRVIRENYTAFLGAEAVNGFIDSGLSDQEIDDGLQNCTVITSAGSIIGFSIISGDLLHLMMIDLPFQNKGYGRLLLAHTETILFQTHHTIRLQTFAQNTRAVQFYSKNGWLPVETKIPPGPTPAMLLFQKPRRPWPMV